MSPHRRGVSPHRHGVSPGPRRRLALALTAALAVVVPLGALTAAAAPAGAAARPKQPALRARVVLDAFLPAAARPGDQLIVSGRIENTGTSTLRGGQVRLRYRPAPVGSRGELARLAAGKGTGDDEPVDASDSAAIAIPSLAPGGRAEFHDLSVPVDDLALGAFGVYPVAVEVRANRKGALARAGITRTFLPWSPDPLEVVRTQVSWLWPLADLPRRLTGSVVETADGARPDRLSDDGLTDAVTSGGRIARLVDAAAGKPVTWVVDPMLLDDVTAMSGGYDVADQATDRPGQGDGAATLFLDRLRGVLTGDGTPATVVPLPYGDPDLVAAHRAGATGRALLSAALAQGTATASAVLGPGVSLRADVAAPPGGQIDQQTLDWLTRSHRYAGAVVLADTGVPAKDAGVTATGRATLRTGSTGSVEALVSDTRLSALTAVDTTHAGAQVLAEQRFLAETAMITAERPGTHRTIVVSPPTRWAPTAEFASQLLTLTGEMPWLEEVPLDQALASDSAGTDRAGLRYPASARRAELPPSYLATVDATGRQLAQTAGVLTDAAALRSAYGLQQVRLLSAGLRADPPRRAALVEDMTSALTAETAGVSVLPTRALLGSRDATFPLSVKNDLDQAVRVRLTFQPDSLKLQVAPVPAGPAVGSSCAPADSGPGPTVTVQPGQKQPLQVHAHALANGVTSVYAQLCTADGATIGTPVLVAVRVAQYGVVGVVLIVVAAVALFLAAVRQVVRRIRGTAGPRPGEELAAGVPEPGLTDPGGPGIPTGADATGAAQAAPDRARAPAAAPEPVGLDAAGAGRGRHAG